MSQSFCRLNLSPDIPCSLRLKMTLATLAIPHRTAREASTIALVLPNRTSHQQSECSSTPTSVQTHRNTLAGIVNSRRTMTAVQIHRSAKMKVIRLPVRRTTKMMNLAILLKPQRTKARSAYRPLTTTLISMRAHLVSHPLKTAVRLYSTLPLRLLDSANSP